MTEFADNKVQLQNAQAKECIAFSLAFASRLNKAELERTWREP